MSPPSKQPQPIADYGSDMDLQPDPSRDAPSNLADATPSSVTPTQQSFPPAPLNTVVRALGSTAATTHTSYATVAAQQVEGNPSKTIFPKFTKNPVNKAVARKPENIKDPPPSSPAKRTLEKVDDPLPNSPTKRLSSDNQSAPVSLPSNDTPNSSDTDHDMLPPPSIFETNDNIPAAGQPSFSFGADAMTLPAPFKPTTPPNTDTFDFQGPSQPDRALTPVPRGGFPTIHGMTKMELFRFVHNDSKAIWEAYDGPKAFVVIANDKIVTEATDRVGLIRDLISQNFDCPSLIVGHAMPFYPSNRLPYKPAFPYLVAGMSQNQINSLVTRKCWSSPKITFLAFSDDPVPTTYAFSLGTIPVNATPANNAIVVEMVKAKLIAAGAQAFISNNRDNIPTNINDEDAFKLIIDSVSVQGITTKENKRDITIFNVYIHPPTIDTTGYQRWISCLKALNYPGVIGTGRPRDPFHCNLCKGLDHITALCQYSEVPGFHNITINSGEAAASEPDTSSFSNATPAPSFANPIAEGNPRRGTDRSRRGNRGTGRGNKNERGGRGRRPFDT